MVDRVYLSPSERELVADILRQGLHQRRDQWRAARIGLARSLQIAEAPRAEDYKVLSQQPEGVELHSKQLTGEGNDEADDFTDVYRALLSVYAGRDLFQDEEEFHRLLQAHVRRGVHEITSQWRPSDDFADYLLREMLFEFGQTPASADDAAELGDRVVRILGQVGVGAKLIESRDGPRITRFTLELETLDDLDRLRRSLSKIGFALGWGENAVTSSLARGERRVFLSVPRPASSWRMVDWQDVRDILKSADAEDFRLPLCFGTDVLGDPLLFDLAEAPHLFIGGTTGSGKSMCLHALLLSLLEGPTPPELVLIDPKAVEFTPYTGNRHLRYKEPITTPESALTVLEDLVEEMNMRQERLRALDARNIDEANERNAEMRRVVVVIDELGDLFMTRREVEVPLIRLAQKARSTGIHLVLATQRPEAATFPGLLRSNIPSRVALTVQKAAESRIILDEGGAESLLMKGDMLIRFAGRSTERAHGCRVTSRDIQQGVAG
ncbi:FtsK/SpoIIIE domain-containing protein [Sphingopyxis sp.]|uniref:FtsK/SpoIIIE domain-containing protein n=1 Tax=Sphingopyxis sp. TaxID=1908224 RepID=UPI002B493854|nr:FtsK/SpoIIIE domain-containing protein [Sphingopyxis sp.]HJS11614.1 FtsK/SpoIIIE domain-containing protein [Sphingopyxis sp.]